MEWYEILIIAVAAVFVVGVFAWRMIRRAQGKGGCDCDCSSCASCKSCGQKKEK